jgi:hypothetical protein
MQPYLLREYSSLALRHWRSGFPAEEPQKSYQGSDFGSLAEGTAVAL